MNPAFKRSAASSRSPHRGGEATAVAQRLGVGIRSVARSVEGLSRASTQPHIIGDGSETEFEIYHALGSHFVRVQVTEASGDYLNLQPDEIARPTPNTVRITFASAPDEDSVAVLIW